jgi:hypothetical protein
MPEINQYTLKHKELVELIIKASDVHEGRWLLSISFQMAPGNFGMGPEEASPGMIVAIQNVGIQREVPGQIAPASLVVDAAEVNPRKSEAVAGGKRERTAKPKLST